MKIICKIIFGGNILNCIFISTEMLHNTAKAVKLPVKQLNCEISLLYEIKLFSFLKYFNVIVLM